MAQVEMLCTHCGKNWVIYPVVVCWFCRQKGVKVPKPPRRRGKIRPYAPRKRWTPTDEELLRRTYSDTSSPELLKLFPGRPIGSIYQHAAILGLKKSEAYLRAQRLAEARRLREHGQAHRFPKGHVPANKGMKGRPSTGRMAETQFKKGNKPHTWMPIGSTRYMDGYLQIKVTDTGYPPRDWRGAHVLLWEEHHGQVPPKHVVTFKDGNKAHIVIENLECIHRRELASRNRLVNQPYPEELKQVIRLIAGLKRRITCARRRSRAEDDRGHERAPVQNRHQAGERQGSGPRHRAVARRGDRKAL